MRISYLFIILVLSGCTTLPRAIEPIEQTKSRTGEHTIYVLRHGWHTGVVLNARDLNQALPDLGNRFESKEYYELGWGDARFYQSKEVTSGLTLQAMFWPTDSVVHVVAFNEKPSKFFSSSEIKAVIVSRENYYNLIEFLRSSLSVGGDNQLVALKKGIYGDSQFFESVGKYYAFNTCNNWTAKALYSAGVDIETSSKLTASSVMGVLN